MSPRTRKLVGGLGLILLVVFWAVAASIVAMGLVTQSSVVQLVFFLVVGTAWIIPAGAIIAWMQRPPRARA